MQHAEKPQPIFLLSGTPGSGKTSVAQALLQRFPLGLHLPVDDFREFVVSGRASVFDWTEETTQQFALARGAAVGVARIYSEAGFAVAIDDVVFPAEAQLFIEPFQAKVYKILLIPQLDTVLKRNAERTNKFFDTAVLAGTIRKLHKMFSEQERDFRAAGWLVLDSSEETLTETVTRILRSTQPGS